MRNKHTPYKILPFLGCYAA